MELVIYSPTPEDFVKAIEWNHDELKTALTNELEKYRHLVFTPETVKDGNAHSPICAVSEQRSRTSAKKSKIRS